LVRDPDLRAATQPDIEDVSKTMLSWVLTKEERMTMTAAEVVNPAPNEAEELPRF
jgi:hypothetical protein